MLGLIFILILLSVILLLPYSLYRLTRTTEEKRQEWSFEGKDWDYWKTHK